MNDIITDRIGGEKLKQDKETEKETIYAVMVPKERHNEPEIIDAKKQEIENWKKFNAFEIVEDIGQPTITTRWVINEKESHDGLKVRHKARLCLRGFMEQEKPRSDSPTISPDMTKTVVAIGANEGWKAECLDVTAAFLQGEELEREARRRKKEEGRKRDKLCIPHSNYKYQQAIGKLVLIIIKLTY